jgi:tetratricopeptide (TPR) repeat protein
MRTPTPEEIESSDYEALVAYCKELGVDHHGEESVLRQRLMDRIGMEKSKGDADGADKPHQSLEKARLLIRLNRPEEAMDLLECTTSRDKVYWLEKGNCYLLLSKPEEALKCYDAALELDGGFGQALVAKQSLLTDLSRLEEALKTASQLPEDLRSDLARIVLLEHAGQYIEALKLCEKVLKTSEFEFVHNVKGLLLMKFERYENALESFERALEMNTAFPEAWNNKGVCLFKLGLAEEAEENLQKALALKNDYGTAWGNRALIAQSAGKLDKAVDFLEVALEYTPTSEGWTNLGMIHLRRRKLKEAGRCIESALELDNTYAEAWNAKGLLLEKRKKFAAARKNFEKALILRPDFQEAEANIARVDKKRHQKA